LSEFEEGDFFLENKETDTIRYCHSYNDIEIKEIAQKLGVRFDIIKGMGNDQLNSYLVLFVD
jgi:hypothetical protein